MQNRRAACLILVFLAHPVYADEDVWFDLGRESYSINLNIGHYSDGGYLQHFGLRAPLVGESEVSIAYSRVTGNDDIVIDSYQYQNNQSALRAAISTDPLARWVGSAGYESGSADLAESYKHWVASLGYNHARGIIQGSVIAGEDELELPVALAMSEPVILNYQRDRIGLGITASYYLSSWIFLGTFRDYTLAADDPTRSDELGSDRDTTQVTPVNNAERRRRRRQIAIASNYSSATASNGFQPIGSITERVWQLSAATTLKQTLIGAGYSGYEGYLSGGAVNSYFVMSAIPITARFEFSVLASIMEDSDAVYSELGAKLHW